MLMRFSGRNYLEKLKKDIKKESEIFIRQINRTTVDSLNLMSETINRADNSVKNLQQVIEQADQLAETLKNNNEQQALKKETITNSTETPVIPNAYEQSDSSKAANQEKEKPYQGSERSNSYNDALQMLAQGLDVEVVANRTNLSMGEVQLLKDLHNK